MVRSCSTFWNVFSYLTKRCLLRRRNCYMSFMANFYLFIYRLGPEMAVRVITQAQSVSSVPIKWRGATVTNRLESSSFVFNILFASALLKAHWDGFNSKPAASLSDFPWDEACFSSLCWDYFTIGASYRRSTRQLNYDEILITHAIHAIPCDLNKQQWNTGVKYPLILCN